MAQRRMTIYKITCIETNKIYIGRTVKKPHKRLLEHFSDSNYILNNSPLHFDMKRYPRESFVIEAICEFYCDNYKEADYVELAYIEKNNAFEPNGYNRRRVKL